MAISETHYRIVRELRERDLLPLGKPILEIGQANFYGDMDTKEIFDDLKKIKDDNARYRLAEKMAKACHDHDLFAIAEVIYAVIFQTQEVYAIDSDPQAKRAHCLDLNSPLDFGKVKYGVSINHGTAEHIFNIANVFRVMHDATVAGGLMIHEAPFTGWVDHGFYCLQPTLFWDLAAANGYEIVGVWVEHLRSKSYFPVESREHVLRLAHCERLPNNAMLFVVFRKGPDAPFKVPMQGVYAGVSAEATDAWRELR